MESAKSPTPGFIWTSIWPMFLVSVLLSGITGGQIGVGGIGSLIIGTILAKRFQKAPVLRFNTAFFGALVPMALFLLIGGALFLYGETVETLERTMSPSAARFGAWVGILFNAAVLTPVLCATWAFFVVRRARKLAAAGLIIPLETRPLETSAQGDLPEAPQPPPTPAP